MVDVELVEVPSETVARVRRRVAVTDMPEFFGRAFEQVMAVVPRPQPELAPTPIHRAEPTLAS